MKWFKIIIGDEAVAKGAIKPIMEAFEQATPLGNESEACALFETDEADGKLVFISPKLAATAPQLLETFAAAECEAPPPPNEGEEFGTSLLLASNPRVAWSLLEGPTGRRGK